MSLKVKPSQPEEEFIAKEEALKKKRLAEELHAKLDGEDREKLKAQHWMRCPKCGLELQTLLFKGVMIDKCYGCGGVYLDNGELEKLAGEEEGLISSIVGLFKYK